MFTSLVFNVSKCVPNQFIGVLLSVTYTVVQRNLVLNSCMLTCPDGFSWTVKGSGPRGKVQSRIHP